MPHWPAEHTGWEQPRDSAARCRCANRVPRRRARAANIAARINHSALDAQPLEFLERLINGVTHGNSAEIEPHVGLG